MLRSAQYVATRNMMLVKAEYIMRIHWTALFGMNPQRIEEIKNDEKLYAYIPIPVSVGTELC